MHKLKHLKKARGLEPADLVLKHCQIVNVYDGSIEVGDIAIADGIILGVGHYHGMKEIDLSNYFVAPGLIDSHVHIESSMLTPSGFAQAVVPFGTTTIIADPHEIANVSGIEGISYMLDASEQLPLDVFVMIPSCVPATSFEHAGASIMPKDIEVLKNHPRVLGLGEMMDYPALLDGDIAVWKKLVLMENKIIDGHIPDLLGLDLSAYAYAGITTDHESTEVAYMRERIKRGMYVHLREGSATRNVAALIKGVDDLNLHRLTFCTDDKHVADILKEGHINYAINLSSKHGLDPIKAIRMATLNAATCYNLKDRGGIAPGKIADFIVFEDLNHINPIYVFKNGLLVAKDGQLLEKPSDIAPTSMKKSLHVDTSHIDLKLKLNTQKVRVIGLIKDNILTDELHIKVSLKDGYFIHDPKKDVLKLVSIERHHKLGHVGVALVHGFGIKSGAFGMSISHDSHNIVIVGSNDEDIKMVLDQIVLMQGGIAVSQNGHILSSLALEVGGLMTASPILEVRNQIDHINNTLKKMGLPDEINDPLITLSFLCLPVIPKLKLTDSGLYDVTSSRFVPVEVADIDYRTDNID